MATIKSHTDIEQSKKLAEFLPLESADMYIYKNIFFGALSCFNGTTQVGEYVKLTDKENKAYPCWSLAALINILPQSIEFKGDNYYLRFMKEYVEYANDEISITGRYLHTTGNDNLVDACVAMIEKLHELNLLSIYRCLS